LTIKTGAGQKFYDLIVRSGNVKLLSNITVDRIFAHPSAVGSAGYTITKTDPTQEYTGMRRTIKKARLKKTGLSAADKPLLEDIEGVS